MLAAIKDSSFDGNIDPMLTEQKPAGITMPGGAVASSSVAAVKDVDNPSVSIQRFHS